MTVYVEVVLLNNLAVDALLIGATMYLRNRKIRKLRFAIATVLGACCAVGYAVLPEAWKYVVRALLAPLMVLIFDKYGGIKDYSASLALFVILTFALGGIVSGISYLIGVEAENYLILGITAAGVFAGLAALRALVASKSSLKRKLCSVTFVFNGQEMTAKGLCDSGNTLTDEVSGLPVVIFSEALADSIRASSGNTCAVEGFIQLKTVNGESSLPIVRIDGVKIGGKQCKGSQAYGALSGQTFDGYEIILQNTMF